MSYQLFEQKWLGKTVDTDGVPKGAVFQCVDLPKQYMRDECDVPFGAYGNAIDYGLHTAEAILKGMDKLPADTPLQPGDVLPLSPVDDKPEHNEGHVGLFTGAEGAGRVEILEQNGATGNGQGKDGDVIRKRFVPRSRVICVLRKKGTPPAAVPSAGSDSYTVHRPIPGYTNAADAAKRVGSNSTVPPGTYPVFNRFADMVNVTRQAGKPGWWINPADNTLSEPAPAPAPAPEPSASPFHVGDTVAPISPVSYTGQALRQFDKTYTISELKGDRAVLKARGAVWAAVNTNNLRHA